MQLDGIRTIYDNEVAYLPGQGLAPVALDGDAMKTFCSPDDADQIFTIARQVVPNAKLVGKTGEFTAEYNSSTHILTAGPDQIYADAGSVGGQYVYRTPNGSRPIRIQSVADGLDQFVSELVASYNGQTGLRLIATPQGKKLQWA